MFLDPTTLEPYEDQWAFLSSIERLSPEAVDALATGFGELPTGPDSSPFRRPRADTGGPKPPAEIRATAGAMLAIDRIGVPPALLAALKHLASLHNPEFYEKEKLRFSTWNTPRFIRCYRETLDQLLLPRGLRDKAAAIVAEAGSHLMVVGRPPRRDRSTSHSAATLTATRLPPSELTDHELGMLVAPPGAGQDRGRLRPHRPSPRADSGDRRPQAARRAVARPADHHLGLTAKQIGQLGGGRNKTTGIVDVAMVQSLARRDDLAELTAGYGLVIVDECHHVPAVTFERAVREIPVRRWLGLTATPYRRDGLQALMAMHCGPIRHRMDTHPGAALRALDLIVHETDHQPVEEGEHIQAVFRGLVEDHTRTKVICDDIADAVGRGRNCLILTRWTEHLDSIVVDLIGRSLDPLVLHGGLGKKARRAVTRNSPNPTPTAECSSPRRPACSAKGSTAHPSTPCSSRSRSSSKAASSNTSDASCGPPTTRPASRSTTTSTRSSPSSPACTTNDATAYTTLGFDIPKKRSRSTVNDSKNRTTNRHERRRPILNPWSEVTRRDRQA